MLESKIEKEVSKYAESLGWLAYKWSSPSQRGVPDHLYFRNGKVIAIEFKQKGKKATKLQLHHLNKLTEAGIFCCVIDDVGLGEALFDWMEK